MADSRTLTKRYFKVAEPNDYGASYVVRTIMYEPEFTNWKGERILEGGYYIEILTSTAKLEQDGGLRSEGPISMWDMDIRKGKTLVQPATRYNQKTAAKILEKYSNISYVQEFCEQRGLTLVSDPNDAAINSPGFAYEHRSDGFYRYGTFDSKPQGFMAKLRSIFPLIKRK